MTEKKYLVSEEELSQLIAKSIKSANLQEAWNILLEFLKSKQEVEEIASGYVELITDRYKNKKIKIYIQEEK